MSVSDFLHSFWLTKLAFGVEKAVVAWQVETRNEGHDKKEKKSRVKREEMLAGMTSLAMTWNCIWMVPQSPSLVRVWLPLLTPLEDFLGKNGSNMLRFGNTQLKGTSNRYMSSPYPLQNASWCFDRPIPLFPIWQAYHCHCVSFGVFSMMGWDFHSPARSPSDWYCGVHIGITAAELAGC